MGDEIEILESPNFLRTADTQTVEVFVRKTDQSLWQFVYALQIHRTREENDLELLLKLESLGDTHEYGLLIGEDRIVVLADGGRNTGWLKKQ